MRILFICLALLFPSSAYAQLPVSGELGYISGLVCVSERASRTLGNAFQTGGYAGFNRTTAIVMKERSCTVVEDNNIPIVIRESLAQWGYQNKYLVLMRATLFTHNRSEVTIYVFFEAEGT